MRAGSVRGWSPGVPEPLRGSGTCFAVARSRPLVRVGCAVYLGETVTHRFVQYLGSTVELGGHLGRSETLKQVTYHVGYAILRVNIALTSPYHPLTRGDQKYQKN